jgi:cellulose biosynthesis protein BcsQ
MIVAVYSAKGGVGKTTLAVNLAWASAVRSRRRTLLWDLDPEGGATFTMGHEPRGKKAQESITGDEDLSRLVQRTETDHLDLLPADVSLRGLERSFQDLGKRKRLAKIAGKIITSYDRIIIDCAPGLTDTADQVLRAADLVVVPVIPAALSARALDHVKDHIGRRDGPRVTLAPVFSMVDRRRALHRDPLAQHPNWPIIRMASAYEQMASRQRAIGSFLPRSSEPVKAVESVWRQIERELAKAK